MIYQKDIIAASKLSKIASKDACLRLVKRMITDGEIIRHNDKQSHNAVYFSEADALKVQAALTAEAERRLTSLQPAAAGKEPQSPEPATVPEAPDSPKAIPEPGPEPEPERDTSTTEPKTIKQLAVAPGPEKRTPSKKAKKSTPDPEHSKLQEKIKGLSKSAWLYVGAGALLLLAFGWYRAHRKTAPMTHVDDTHAPADKDLHQQPQKIQPRAIFDADQLERWNEIFKGT